MPSGHGFTLTQLRYFVAVAEAGSITQAAENLLIAQSAVSTAIANVERQLSIQLFIRNRAKGVKLTQAGETFLVHTRELLNHASELGEFGRDLGESLSGRLGIGCFAFIAPFFLPALLARFKALHPLVKLSLIEDHLDGVQRSLLSGMCDLAMLYDVKVSNRLQTEVVQSYPPYALLPEGHRLAGNERVTLKDLEKEPLIQIDLPNSRDYVGDLAKRAGVEFDIVFRTTSFEMVRSLVGHGHGYAILNQRTTDRTYDGKRVVIRELADDLPPIRLVLAHVAGARQSRRALAFATVCREFFRFSCS